MNTLFVTGATGFVGRHLCTHLLERGSKVHALVRPRDELPKELRGCVIHPYSNGETVRKALHDSKPDVVIHLASLFLAENTYEQVEPLIQSNVLLGTQLVDAMTREGCLKLVSAGTAWQNFNSQKGTASCLYAATKEAFESILRYYVDAEKLEVCVLKLFDTYGPRDERRKLLLLLREAARSGQKLGLSPGEQKIDLLHVRDAVSAFVMAAQTLHAQKGPRLEEYYLRSGQLMTIRKLVETFTQATGAPLDVEFGKRPYRAREVMVPWSDGESLPGWSAQISLDEGLKEYMNEKLYV